jgi:hypothetical protein
MSNIFKTPKPPPPQPPAPMPDPEDPAIVEAKRRELATRPRGGRLSTILTGGGGRSSGGGGSGGFDSYGATKL